MLGFGKVMARGVQRTLRWIMGDLEELLSHGQTDEEATVRGGGGA